MYKSIIEIKKKKMFLKLAPVPFFGGPRLLCTYSSEQWGLELLCISTLRIDQFNYFEKTIQY